MDIGRTTVFGTNEESNMSKSDVHKVVSAEQLKKLENELVRAKSEVRDLKELIIKMQFDKYGF